ncbi:MAG: response regulator [Planctomycetes bacterium]|nr:response regulator [Planctomycetota bacterium]
MGSILRILVVDDRPDSVLFLTEFLLSRSHRVETCGNGTEALEAIVRRHRTADAYDLLISDVAMPSMDGLSLLKELRRRHLTLPVALYTAFGSMHPNLSHQAQQHGCLVVLDKPIELRRVENLLDEVAARRNGSQRQEKDQPFFGTSRVTRSSTTTAYRRETSQPADFEAPQSGAYALEPKQVIPLPPSQPLVSDQGPIPLPPPPLPRVPPPIRTPLPFPLEQQEPHTRSMPSFRTPLPQTQERRGGSGRAVNPAFRTPLPFLQQGAQVTNPPTPAIPPSVSAAPPMRSGEKPGAPILPGNEETGAPPQPPTHNTTSFVRRSVNPPTQRVTAPTSHVRRPSGLFLQNNAAPTNPDAPAGADAPANPVGTSRIRRTVTGSYTPSPLGAGQGNPQNRPPVNAGGATRAVACAHCRKVFMVAVRPTAYTAMCVHCGQVNRIDPL